MLSTRRKVAFSLLMLGLFALAAEIILRVFDSFGTYSDRGGETVCRDPLSAMAVADELGWRTMANAQFENVGIVGAPLITADEHGYRNGYGWPSDKPIVLVVGDSLMFCAEVPDDSTIPSVIAKKLDDVCVLNGAVRGYGTLQSYRQMLQCFERYGERIVCVLYQYCDNDPAETLMAHLRAPLRSPVLKGGVACDADYGDMKGMPVSQLKLKPRQKPWVSRVSALGEYIEAKWRRVYPLMPDGSFAVDGRAAFHWQQWAGENGGFAAIEILLGKMKQECDRRGAALLVTDFEEDGDEFLSIAREIGVVVIDVRDQHTPPYRRYDAVRTNGQDDGHFNQAGCELMGNALVPLIEEELEKVIRPKRTEECRARQ